MSSNTAETTPVNEVFPITIDKILPVDTLAEAGHKVLLTGLAQIRQYEVASAGSESDLQSLSLAVRQMRGALKLVKSDHKSKTLRRYRRSVRHLARSLNNLQMLVRFIAELRGLEPELEPEQQETLKALLKKLDAQQARAQQELHVLLESKEQLRFFESLTAFSSPVADKASKIAPSQVRQLLPVLIYDRMAILRAYEDAMTESDAALLPALRLQFQRLLDTVAPFEVMLGKQMSDFIEALTATLAALDGINDVAAAQTRPARWINTGKKRYTGILDAYTKYCETRASHLMSEFEEQWARFNSRKIQQKLATALVTLYEG